MSRSVSYLTGAQAVAYLTAHEETEDSWDYFVQDITESLKSLFPSLQHADRWDGNEEHIILENGHAEIAIAEYCGLVSISIRALEEADWYTGRDSTGLHTRWVQQVQDKFLSIGTLKHQGTFINGEAVFTTKDAEHTFSSKEGLCEWLEPEPVQ
jgi:hypothetical protein